MIKIPLRDPHEPLDAKAITDLASTLSGEEKLVTRELLTECHRVGLRTMGQVHEFIRALEPTERKAMLDALRKRLGMNPKEPTVKRTGGDAYLTKFYPCCAGCGQQPVDPYTGTMRPLERPVRRWWCASCRHLASPGDFDEVGTRLVFAEGGAIREIDDAETARQAAEAESRRRRHEQELAARKVEVEAMEAEKAARDEAFHSELGPGVPG